MTQASLSPASRHRGYTALPALGAGVMLAAHVTARVRTLGFWALGCGMLPVLVAGQAAQAQSAGSGFGSGGSIGGGLGGSIGYGSGILPTTGFGNALPNLRDFVDTPLAKGGSQLFTFDASLGAQAGYIDNVGGVASGGPGGQKPQGSFEGRLSPTISVAGGARKVQVNFTYDPVLYYYPQVNAQSRIDQNLNGAAQIELYDQLAYLNLQAFASQVPVVNGYGQASAAAISRNQLEQLYSISANPYLVHQFGDIGTGKLSYTIGDSVIQTSSGQNSAQLGQFGVAGNGQNSRTLTQAEDASFTSGEAFGRIEHAVDLSGQQNTGSGALASSYRYQATYMLTYAVNRFVSVNGKVGYEDLHYSSVFNSGVLTQRAYNLNAPLGSAGITLTPNPDSMLALSYGYVDGGTSLTLNASYKPTARLMLFATSSSGVTTNLQQLQSYATTAQTNLAGVTIDPRTGAPIQFSNGGANTGSAAYRLTQSSLTGVLELNRDTLTAGVTADQRSSPGGNTVTSAGNGGTLTGSDLIANLGWQHQLSETLNSSATGSYGITQTKGQGTSPFMVANASLTQTFSERLSGSMNYSLYRRLSSAGNPGVTVNEILLGLLQKF